VEIFPIKAVTVAIVLPVETMLWCCVEKKAGIFWCPDNSGKYGSRNTGSQNRHMND
jgi:hypothetical protein